MFLLKLAVTTGWTVEECEKLPVKTLRELQVLNRLNPFTYDENNRREAFIATLLYNHNATKKAHIKTVADLFPYTANKIPDDLEDEIVLKARRILDTIQTISTFTGKDSGVDDFRIKLEEQLQIEQTSPELNPYRVMKLTEMLESMKPKGEN